MGVSTRVCVSVNRVCVCARAPVCVWTLRSEQCGAPCGGSLPHEAPYVTCGYCPLIFSVSIRVPVHAVNNVHLLCPRHQAAQSLSIAHTNTHSHAHPHAPTHMPTLFTDIHRSIQWQLHVHKHLREAVDEDFVVEQLPHSGGGIGVLASDEGGELGDFLLGLPGDE